MRLFKAYAFKTLIIALLISFCLAAGLTCLLIWFSIVSFNAMAEAPIEYPASIVGGLVSLAAFTLSVLWYITSRKGYWSLIGILADALTVFVSLPVWFGVIAEYVYPWLQKLV